MSPTRKRRRGRGGGAGPREPQHTSVPTSRNAYQETRRWLLEHHGPVCAYCGRTYKPEDITLDHVAPRRGQSAYDRRDNLVLACKNCNSAKADMPILAFLLRGRERAVQMAKYSGHLSGMLRKMIGELAGVEVAPVEHDKAGKKKPAAKRLAPDPLAKALRALLDGRGGAESPYRD